MSPRPTSDLDDLINIESTPRRSHRQSSEFKFQNQMSKSFQRRMKAKQTINEQLANLKQQTFNFNNDVKEYQKKKNLNKF